MKTQSKKKVGIWVTGIVGLKGESDRALEHIKRAKAYAGYRRWEVVKQYSVPSNTTSKLRSTALEEMLQDVKTGTIQGLIIPKLARLSRSAKDLIEIAEHFQKYDADLISISESIDTSTAGGKLLFHVLSTLVQWEYEQINERVREFEKQNQVK